MKFLAKVMTSKLMMNVTNHCDVYDVVDDGMDENQTDVV
jgi:hypothetical protein